eukprot:ctg_110.g42
MGDSSSGRTPNERSGDGQWSALKKIKDENTWSKLLRPRPVGKRKAGEDEAGATSSTEASGKQRRLSLFPEIVAGECAPRHWLYRAGAAAGAPSVRAASRAPTIAPAEAAAVAPQRPERAPPEAASRRGARRIGLLLSRTDVSVKCAYRYGYAAERTRPAEVRGEESEECRADATPIAPGV